MRYLPPGLDRNDGKTAANQVAAVILAAGEGKRMGRFKPLLELGGLSFLETLAAAFGDAGVSKRIIVTGYRQAALMPVIKRLQVDYAFNPRYREEMWLSVQCGAAALPDDIQAFFIMPVDIPGVRASTLEAMILVMPQLFASGRYKVIYPVYKGRRGHPPLISCDIRPELLRWTGPGGLKGFLRQYEESSFELVCDDPGILKDYDWPGDLETLQGL